MDQGVIKNFKLHYRRILVHSYLVAIEEHLNVSIMKISIKYAVNMPAIAWNEVKSSNISNCHKKKSFLQPIPAEVVVNEVQYKEPTDNLAWGAV